MSIHARSPLRFLAPVALIAFGLALLLVVSGNRGDSGSGAPSAAEAAKQRDLAAAKAKRQQKASPSGQLPKRTYTVKSGDTLGSISEKVGIPVEKLQELNPELDPQQLVSGQKIKLRE